MANVEFSSDESDNDDEITFRDQLENIGENFGKQLEKSFKKARKNEKNIINNIRYGYWLFDCYGRFRTQG